MNLLSATSVVGKTAYGYTASGQGSAFFTVPSGKTVRIDNINMQQNISIADNFYSKFRIYDSSASAVMFDSGWVYTRDQNYDPKWLPRFLVFRGPFYLDEGDYIDTYSSYSTAGLFYISFGYLEIS